MKIKSKINGAISNVRGDIAREMVKLGVAEYAEEGVVSAPAAQGEESYRLPRPGDASDADKTSWAVVRIAGPTKSYLAIQLKTLNDTHTWAGGPRYANAKREWPGGFVFRNGLGREIPQDILNQYTDACKKNPSLVYPFSLRAAEAIATYQAQSLIPDDNFPSNKRQAEIAKENIKKDRELTTKIADGSVSDIPETTPAIAWVGDDNAGEVTYEVGDYAKGI